MKHHFSSMQYNPVLSRDMTQKDHISSTRQTCQNIRIHRGWGVRRFVAAGTNSGTTHRSRKDPQVPNCPRFIESSFFLFPRTASITGAIVQGHDLVSRLPTLLLPMPVGAVCDGFWVLSKFPILKDTGSLARSRRYHALALPATSCPESRNIKQVSCWQITRRPPGMQYPVLAPLRPAYHSPDV